MKLYCDSCKKPFTAEIIEEKNECSCPECQKIIAVPENNVAPGVVLGDFLIESVISSGGMGIVYLARQLSLDRHVALKVLQSKHIDDKEYVESLYREARAAAKISHPNVVQAYAIGEDDGVFYFAMEYIKGNTFKTILKEKGGKLEFKEAAKVIRDIARALSAAWREQKLVHQDIKPDNIMLDANGFAKLADLGLARTASTVQGETDDSDEVLGTPQYISPEQLTGVPTDVRSDIYSLGATFYQFVTGRFAYVADSLDDLPRLHVEGNLEPPQNVNPELPDSLNKIILKMMARQPENRYQNPDDLVSDLEKFLSEPAKPAAPRIGGNAVPKLKLNASKGTSSVPGTAKPVTPAAKPATPKQPLSLNLNGAKPATPPAAKPAAVPPKPATPPATKPAPVATPAVPKPATPAAPPAAKPAAAPSPEVKPAVPAAEAVNVKPAPQQPPAEKKEKEHKESKSSSEIAEKLAAIFGTSFKWVALGIAVVLILGIGFSVTVMILNSKGKLPGFLAPVGKYLNTQAGAAKAKAIELAKPQDIVEEKTPAGPVTRPEFLKSVEDIINFRMLNPQAGEKFLSMADAAYPMLMTAATGEEIAALERFLKVYSPIDEKLRCAAPREKLRSAYVKKLDLAAAARAKLEAERLAQIEAQKRKEQEAAELAAKIDEQNKIAQAQQAKYYAQLKKDCQTQGEKLAEAMLDAAINDDRTALDSALLDADDFIRLSLAQSVEEKREIAKLSGFIKALNTELKNLQLYKRRLGNIRGRHGLYLTLADKDVVLVENIVPGGITCRNNDTGLLRTVNLHKLPASSRNTFVKVMSRRFKQLKNPGFFIGVFDRNVDALALKDIPAKGFWKDYWHYFARILKK